MESFHAALTAQTVGSKLGTLEDELLRGIIISKLRNAVLQDTLRYETLSPDVVLEKAWKIESNKQTTLAFQKSNAVTASTRHSAGSPKKMKTRICNSRGLMISVHEKTE